MLPLIRALLRTPPPDAVDTLLFLPRRLRYAARHTMSGERKDITLIYAIRCCRLLIKMIRRVDAAARYVTATTLIHAGDDDARVMLRARIMTRAC